MSLYAEYVKERASRETVETENGFMTFQIQGNECFIHDAYVRPAFREGGTAAAMLGAVTTIAREHGCTILSCTVCPSANGSTESMKVILACGFKLGQSVQNLISFVKEI